MSLEPEIQGVSCVLRGDFIPTMFQPSWMAANDLILAKEAEAAKVEIISPQIAIFKVEWLKVTITEDRFLAETQLEPYYETLRDLVISIFTILNHTPMRLMGINRQLHYQLESEEAWHAVGDSLAPKQDWVDVLETPGMRSLLMEGKRPDEFEGYLRVKVEPSVKIKNGVFIEINDHFQFPSASESSTGAKIATDILSAHWNKSLERGLEIAQKIVSLGELK